MTAHQIRKAIGLGEKVYWSNLGYEVIKDTIGQFLIKADNGYCVGLTHTDNITLNGDPKAFFIWNETHVVIEKLVEHEIADIMRMAKEDDFVYLENILRGGGFTQYSRMSPQQLNEEWETLLLFDIDEGSV